MGVGLACASLFQGEPYGYFWVVFSSLPCLLANMLLVKGGRPYIVHADAPYIDSTFFDPLVTLTPGVLDCLGPKS